jgi:hypothetical protein
MGRNKNISKNKLTKYQLKRFFLFLCTKIYKIPKMKKLILVFSAVALIFSSCSSDADSLPVIVPLVDSVVDVNGVLLKKDIYTYNSVAKETNYTYTGNKLNRITDYDGEYSLYTYTGNLITKIEYFDVANTLLTTENLTYDSNNKLVTYIEIDGLSGYKENYVYNTDGTVSFSSFHGSNVSQTTPGDTGVMVVANGEVVRRTENHSGGGVDQVTYTYDGKNSPFKNVIGLDKIVFRVSYIDFGNYHNPLTFLFTSTGNPTDSQNSTYTYNSNDFPITRTETGSSPSDVGTTQYFYQ